MHTVFGNADTAKKLWPAAMQFKMAMEAVNPEAGEKQFFAAFKAAELSTASKNGHIVNPADFEHRLDLFAKVYAGSMGRVAPTDLYAFTKQAKYSRYSLTDEALYKAAALMYEQGGSVIGSAYQALARVAGGKLGNSSAGSMYAKEWERMGLLTDISERSKHGNPTRFHVQGRDLLFADPNKWAESILLPAMMRKGFDMDKNKGAFLEQLIRMFGNQTAGNAVFTMLQQRGILHKDAEVFRYSKGPAALSAEYQNGYKGSFEALGKSLLDLHAVIGKAMKPVIVPGIKALTNVIRSLTEWVRNHPGITRIGVAFGFIAGAALIAGGALMTLVTLFGVTLPAVTVTGGLAILGAVGVLLASIAALVYNPKGVLGAFQWLVNAIIGVIKTPGGMALSIAGGLSLNKSLVEVGTKLGKDGMTQMGLIKTSTPSGHHSSTTNHVSIRIDGSKDPHTVATAVKQVLINPTGGFTSTMTGGFRHAYGLAKKRGSRGGSLRTGLHLKSLSSYEDDSPRTSVFVLPGSLV